VRLQDAYILPLAIQEQLLKLISMDHPEAGPAKSVLQQEFFLSQQ